MSSRKASAALAATFVLTVSVVLLLQSPSPRRVRASQDVLGGLRELVDHRRAHAAPTFEREALEAASRHGLDPLLVLAVIEAESGSQPHLVSDRGAFGLMQITPEIAAWAQLSDLDDPEVNLEVGCKYLAWLLDGFGGDLTLALAAYNAGPGAVRRWGTVPPYRETRLFIARVASAYERLAGRPLPPNRPRRMTSAAF
ncbi:MAG TPA: lytic transglycosylase domain-containing protein [Thermoanaerobaculaceae bacterium]|nr:lytic transglycosylase domain-containing protein [Thermoanaerobaculaceae bacterium]